MLKEVPAAHAVGGGEGGGEGGSGSGGSGSGEGGGGDGGLGGGCGGRPGGGVSCEKQRKILEDALLAWKDSCVVEPIAHIMLVGSMFGSMMT